VQEGQILQQLLFFGMLLLGLYLLVIRPQRARAKALAQIRASLAPGARVITTAGIHGTVLAVEDDEVVIEISSRVPVRFMTAAVVRIVEPGAGTEEAGPR
jgi:preprotein translocase subunit YajC